MRRSQVIQFRRRRKGYTDYRKRLKLLMSKKLRLIVRKSHNNMTLQLSEYNSEGDKILVGTRASELRKHGWNGNLGNMPAAYLSGLLLAQKAKKSNIKDCILDIGFQTSVKGARIYAALKGALDGGLRVPFSKENLPSEDRIMGKHIVEYASKLKTDKELYERKYSGYIKRNTTPEQVLEMFSMVKERLKEK